LGRQALPRHPPLDELDRGGHFAAFEQPELFVDEVRSFFRLVR
jgi:pimeloyl-ACP methyl ester carboxylesterase